MALATFQITPDYAIFYILPLSCFITFYTVNWEEYHTGMLRTVTTSAGIRIGVTEG